MFSFAQIHTSETWTEVGVSSDIFDDLSFSFVAESRFYNETFQLKTVSGDIGFDYKLSKNMRVGISHKIAQKNQPEGYFPTHTSSVNFQYKDKIKKFRFSYRNKFGMSKSMFVNETSDLYYSYENRNRIKISYNKKKLKLMPTVSVESFHPIQAYKPYRISEIRYAAGVTFDLKKKFELEIGYLYKQMLYSKIPESTSVFSIALSKEL